MIHVSSTRGNDNTGNGNIDRPYATLTKAINMAYDGNAIFIDPGIYNSFPNINKSVMIHSLNMGISGHSLERTNESNEVVFLNTNSSSITNDVILDGLKFKQTNVFNDLLIINGNSVVINNCIFERIADTAGQISRAVVTSTSADNYIIENNLFTGSLEGGLFSQHKTWNNGVWLNSGGKLGLIKNNYFVNCRTAMNADVTSSILTNYSSVVLSNNNFSSCGTYVAFGGTSPVNLGMNIENNIFNMSNLGSALINNSNVSSSFELNITNNKFQFDDEILSSVELSLLQKFTIETRLFHKEITTRKGHVRFSQDEQFVIAPSNLLSIALLRALHYAPSSGETIYVSSGTYGSSSVTAVSLNKSVIINGSNENINHNSIRNDETHLLNFIFNISANNVTINGIKITGTQLGGGTIFGGNNTTFSNLVVKNSIIEDVNGMCLYYQGSGVRDGILFDNCKISGIGNGTGLGTSSAFNPWNCMNVTINNCLIENVDYNGINLESVENAVVTNNVIRNIGKSGIQLANNCKGHFNITNNHFSQINCRYYGWGQMNLKSELPNPYAPRSVLGISAPDWQFYYAGIKWFSSSNPLIHIGTYTIEENTFNNSWCGYQFARELPSSGGPMISFKNNIFMNNTHGDVMIYRSNTTNVLYDLMNNGLENASIQVFDWSKAVGNEPDTIEQWINVFNRGTEHRIVLDKTSPAIVQVESGKLVALQNMSLSTILSKSVDDDVIQIGEGTYNANIDINKSISLLGENKNTTIIQSLSNSSLPTIQFVNGSSGSSINGVSIKGKFSTQTSISDSNNNHSAILFTSNTEEINNINIENLIIKNASNGIAFNNLHSNNINIKNCIIENNQGSGIRIASNTQTMNGLNIENCTIQNNNLNAIVSNPSGSYRPNCTNFFINSCIIKDNNLITVNNSHDISIFGFNGNIEIVNTSIHSNHGESKLTNGSLQTNGGWGLIIYGATINGAFEKSGNISLSNLLFTGSVTKSCLGIDRYSELGNIIMNNVDIKEYSPNVAEQTWLQVVIGHKDVNKSFDMGNTKLKTLQVTQNGNIDARQSLFYNVLTGQLLNKQDAKDVIQITKQIYDKLDFSSLGSVIFSEGNNYIAPNEPNGILNSIVNSQTDTTLNLLEGIYNVKTLETPTNIIILKALSTNQPVILKNDV